MINEVKGENKRMKLKVEENEKLWERKNVEFEKHVHEK